jgi:hypothetical protein
MSQTFPQENGKKNHECTAGVRKLLVIPVDLPKRKTLGRGAKRNEAKESGGVVVRTEAPSQSGADQIVVVYSGSGNSSNQILRPPVSSTRQGLPSWRPVSEAASERVCVCSTLCPLHTFGRHPPHCNTHDRTMMLPPMPLDQEMVPPPGSMAAASAAVPLLRWKSSCPLSCQIDGSSCSVFSCGSRRQGCGSGSQRSVWLFAHLID